MTLEGKYEYYRCVQHDFNEAYKIVNRCVSDLYMLPKKLVENTGPMLDQYVKEYSIKGSNADSSLEVIIDFINQLDEFTQSTVELLNEHKQHAEKSKEYLKKVAELNEKCSGRMVSEYAVDYVELTPELTELNNGLKGIKSKADEMVNKLHSLEMKWEDIRMEVRA